VKSRSGTVLNLSQAIELKFKAPTAHTFLEVIRVRWGTAPYVVFFFVGIMTNLLVSINMLQGAVVVINALTGKCAAPCFRKSNITAMLFVLHCA